MIRNIKNRCSQTYVGTYVEFLKEELKEKNDVIRNLLMTNNDESYIETSSEPTMENENQNLINLNEDINNILTLSLRYRKRLGFQLQKLIKP